MVRRQFAMNWALSLSAYEYVWMIYLFHQSDCSSSLCPAAWIFIQHIPYYVPVHWPFLKYALYHFAIKYYKSVALCTTCSNTSGVHHVIMFTFNHCVFEVEIREISPVWIVLIFLKNELSCKKEKIAISNPKASATQRPCRAIELHSKITSKEMQPQNSKF